MCVQVASCMQLHHKHQFIRNVNLKVKMLAWTQNSRNLTNFKTESHEFSNYHGSDFVFTNLYSGLLLSLPETAPDHPQVKSGVHSKPRPATHCMVLPPGKYNSVIPIALSSQKINFITLAVSCLPVYCCNGNKFFLDYRSSRGKWNNAENVFPWIVRGSLKPQSPKLYLIHRRLY